MTTGSISSFDFNIAPSNTNSPDFSKDSSNYIFELRFADDNTEPINYRLAKIEPTNNIGNTKSTNSYRAYIEDLCLKNNYRDNVKLVLRHKISGSITASSHFCVSYNIDSLTTSLLDLGLPLVIINTVNNEMPTCEYVPAPNNCLGAGITNTTKVPGSLEIMKGSDIVYYSGMYDSEKNGMTIKIRGNTSAYHDKKPYKIKLQKKADLLDRGNNKVYNDKEWLLLRYNGLRTPVGFKINELLNIQWTPSYQFVNVIINGEYHGLYMLTESIKRNNNCRLTIDDTGFIIEYDAYWWNEDLYFVSEWAPQMNYTFKYPDEDEITKEQIHYIKSYIDSLENKINNGEEYEQYIDVESWAKWILAHDILGTWDAGGSNMFITKYDNTYSSKLMMANLWDFDSSYAQIDTWSTAHTISICYFNKLFNNKNPLFRNTYKSVWENTHNSVFLQMNEFLSSFLISETTTNIDKSIMYDNLRWNTKNGAISKEIAPTKTWFESRLDFLNENIQNL